MLTELCYYLRLKQNAKFKNLTNRRADEIIDKQISFYEKKLDELREKKLGSTYEFKKLLLKFKNFSIFSESRDRLTSIITLFYFTP